MDIKNLVVQISKEDIRNFLMLQNKIKIKEVTIDENINIVNEIQFLSKQVESKCVLSIVKVEDNNIYVDIKKFSISKFNIINKMFKKFFNYFIEAFTDIKGVNFEGECFKLDIDKVINQYYKEENIINLKELKVTNVEVNEGYIDLVLEGINIDTNKIDKNKDFKKELDEEEEFIEVDAFEEELTTEKIKKYEVNFSETKFFSKIKEYSKSAGVSVIYAALILYYTYKDEKVPLTAKALSLGALGYFIIPTDLIPDIMILTGYSDDFIALITAIKSITTYIDDDIKLKAKNRMEEWFVSIDEKELERVNSYLY